jgi:hypothetical protein
MVKYLLQCSGGIAVYFFVPGSFVYGCIAACTHFIRLASECEAVAYLNSSECHNYALLVAVILLIFAALILILSTLRLTNYLLALRLNVRMLEGVNKSIMLR